MKFVFLDRDGVINRYPGENNYVSNLKGFKFLKGSLDGIKILSRSGYKVCVVSNQSGISKGLYSKKTLSAITGFMRKSIEKSGGVIFRTLYCTHAPDAGCACRKPKDGLLRLATKGRKVDLDDCYFIGDNLLDIKTGKKFGCRTILVFSGKEKAAHASQWDVQPDFVAKNLLSAARNIVAKRYERA
jgi:D-glycero-D-manno-heptose 1,7-bisphosphate phosphatase